ncbi:hypothetical protein D1AOALGA4SA_714 [Olavius algarvensis Delta 1 endosymbiont]|nr:hypothetical protein D1AOALGA4SA_714 [Olavius algarvensis Delta 1 endosymbiont]
MEYWETETDDGLILYFYPCNPYKNRSLSAKPSIPIFQYSIIPCIRSRHSIFSLTWTSGSGFRC